jgi:hypothetical protein
MPQARLAFSSLALSALFAVALATPPVHAQPRPGQPGQLSPGPAQPSPGPGQPAQRGPAPGQPPQPVPPKPYKEVAVMPPQASSDPSFEAFRKQLADIAKKKDRAALARLVVPANFFWMGEKGDKANKRKSSMDNLAEAIDLDDKEGSGWFVIGRAAEEPSLEPIPQKRGVFCSPASPMFDERAAEQLAKDTGTDPGDWAYPDKPGLDVHASAQPNSPVIGKLGMYLIRVMPEEPPPGNQAPEPQFVRVVMPNGKVGFVAEEFLSALEFDQLCYIKDASGWKIAGYAGGN